MNDDQPNLEEPPVVVNPYLAEIQALAQQAPAST